jgi:23S rRNA (guanosine2251-2'-O)-methyltransferase
MSELIYGTNVVRMAIETKQEITNLKVAENNTEIIEAAKNNKYKYSIVSKEELNKVEAFSQGVIAEIPSFVTYNIKDIANKDSSNKPSLIVALDGLEDPHNLGAILRTADAANVNGIVYAKNRSVKLNKTVAKVSTGAIFSVKTVEVINLVQSLKQLKELGYWIVGAEATEKSVDYRSMKYDMPTVLVLGSEGKGLSRLVEKECDFLVQIPMMGKVNSLNVSVSAGILIYEIIKYQ